MGKRSNFERSPRDFYRTPADAVKPLLSHLNASNDVFCEPCAGDGALVEHLEKGGALCLFPSDIQPSVNWVLEKDGSKICEEDLIFCRSIITNPPFQWQILKPLLDTWIPLIPTILLLPADFMHNKRFAPYLKHCEKIVSIGRVKWIEGSPHMSADNFGWFFFQPHKCTTIFIGQPNG